MKKLFALVLSLSLVLTFLAAWSGSRAPAFAEETEEEENYDTGDASLDDPLNADEIGEKELLVVSFGTSFNDSRRMTIGGIERALQKAFPDCVIVFLCYDDSCSAYRRKVTPYFIVFSKSINAFLEESVLKEVHLVIGIYWCLGHERACKDTAVAYLIQAQDSLCPLAFL